MKRSRHIAHASTLAITVVMAGCSSMEFTHVKPGQSARLEVATRNAPTAQPVPQRAVPVMAAQRQGVDAPLPGDPGFALDPSMPDPNNITTKAADAYTRGSLAMESGQTGEAILALEDAVKADPTYSDAWIKLAQAYEKAGDSKKALAAYKEAKKLGHGDSTTPPLPPGLGLIP